MFIRGLLLLWGTVLDASTFNAFEWILIHVPLFVPAYLIAYLIAIINIYSTLYRTNGSMLLCRRFFHAIDNIYGYHILEANGLILFSRRSSMHFYVVALWSFIVSLSGVYNSVLYAMLLGM